MKILAIETSCDETAVAIVEDGTKVLSNVIASSRATFEHSGGVIPEEAAREQLTCMLPVLHRALEETHLKPADLDLLAVTRGPGLLGSLLVGTTAARLLSVLWKKPLVGVHHTLGHLSSTWLCTNAEDPPTFPLLTLSASGGHTDLWIRQSHTRGQLVGRSRDDAAGEAFDKGASLLGLSYPGGPAIAKAAQGGDAHAFPFPLPLHGKEETLDFSFSGLKTALRYTLRDLPEGSLPLQNLAASYEHAICRHLCDRTERAVHAYPDIQEIHVVGGVSANGALRTMLREALPTMRIRFPEPAIFCTDNAAMIAAAAAFLIEEAGMEEACAAFETVASLPLEDALQKDKEKKETKKT